jgi:hypothetical protein
MEAKDKVYDETRYFKLVKPRVGASGWGDLLNKNFDKIDERLANSGRSLLHFGHEGILPKSTPNALKLMGTLLLRKGYAFIREGYITGVAVIVDMPGENSTTVAVQINEKRVLDIQLLPEKDCAFQPWDLTDSSIIRFSPGDRLAAYSFTEDRGRSPENLLCTVELTFSSLVTIKP